jgi:HEPN domain-containing protein
MDDDARRKRKPIVKLLDAANLDLDAAARLLTEPPNVLAANHLQQAAEKILSAVRLDRGLLNTKDHDLVILVDG